MVGGAARWLGSPHPPFGHLLPSSASLLKGEGGGWRASGALEISEAAGPSVSLSLLPQAKGRGPG
jgi:hypothetical protein